MRDWHARNPGYQSRFNSAARERARERRRRPGEQQREKEKRQMQRLSNPARYLLRKSRARAKHKGFEFDLTLDWLQKRMASGRCEATGIELTNETGTAAVNNPWAATIDRRDPSQGYTMDNCWIVCWAYNCAKQAWDEKTVLTMAKALVENRQ